MADVPRLIEAGVTDFRAFVRPLPETYDEALEPLRRDRRGLSATGRDPAWLGTAPVDCIGRGARLTDAFPQGPFPGSGIVHHC